MDRLEYADVNRDRYTTWAENVAVGPASAVRRVEFAILSANTQFATAVTVWRESRFDTNPVQAMFGAQRRKAVDQARDNPDRYPRPDYYEFRNDTKLPGLGYSKHSFAACLVDPLGSNIICLDTHMAKCYNVDPKRVFASPDLYKRVEAQVLTEAATLDMAPFVYQWAVWDHTRGRSEDHRFLWEEN